MCQKNASSPKPRLQRGVAVVDPQRLGMEHHCLQNEPSLWRPCTGSQEAATGCAVSQAAGSQTHRAAQRVQTV